MDQMPGLSVILVWIKQPTTTTELELTETIRKKKIKVRRALILGNFYNRQVEILRNFYSGDNTIRTTVIGIKPDELITKEGMVIPLSSIQCIYQL